MTTGAVRAFTWGAALTVLVATTGGGALGCVSVHGDIRSQGPPLGDFDLVADHCDQPWESEAGAGEWIAVDKAGRRVAIGIFGPDFSWRDRTVTIARLDDRRKVSLTADGASAKCRVFDVAQTMNQNDEDFNGHMRLDCDTAAGGHITAALVFRHCVGY